MYRKEKNEKDVRYILEHLRDEDRHEAIFQKGENYIEECLKDIMDKIMMTICQSLLYVKRRDKRD